ncbi:GNAT family N-acetyltransferase [Rummeliibacillus sp. SL167]|uniref:GNAT family N-acetyltransferase n=1 Tax=Rummeliibacillus sp. SL167 TaxID=2579792 RepID=UPI0011B3E8F2|nr:GNAT family N-acetyltransferase [Rummeliibacillus sp. SL167]
MNVFEITTQEDLQREFDIRIRVFVEEQKVPKEEEIDSYDHLGGECYHFLVTTDEDQAIGTGRVRLVDGIGKLQRVAVLEEYRSHGIGRIIIQALEDKAKELGASKVKLDGQIQAQGFYEKLGYEVKSGVFLDAGIEHVLMVKSFK